MLSLSRKKILVFLGLTVVFSSIFYYLIVASGSVQAYSLGLMWSPGAAALITQVIFHRSVRGLGWGVRPVKYLLAGYGLPVVYGLVVYGLVWLSGLAQLAPEALAQKAAAQLGLQVHSTGAFLAIYLLIMATAGVVVSLGSALGEEIGWRGLLVPELAKETSFTATALISGGIWALWHYPVILFANYNSSGAPRGFGLICFTVMVLGLSFAFAWLRLKSGSLWVAALLHASHNLFIQQVFTPLTASGGWAPYLIDEFGVGLAVAAVVIAYLFWRRRAEVARAVSAPQPAG
jgi:membrane protease YdiL (CAAX protease family)